MRKPFISQPPTTPHCPLYTPGNARWGSRVGIWGIFFFIPCNWQDKFIGFLLVITQLVNNFQIDLKYAEKNFVVKFTIF